MCGVASRRILGCVSNAAQLIVAIGIYALGIGLFQALGGLTAAADAPKRWGRASSTVRQPKDSTP